MNVQPPAGSVPARERRRVRECARATRSECPTRRRRRTYVVRHGASKTSQTGAAGTSSQTRGTTLRRGVPQPAPAHDRPREISAGTQVTTSQHTHTHVRHSHTCIRHNTHTHNTNTNTPRRTFTFRSAGLFNFGRSAMRALSVGIFGITTCDSPCVVAAWVLGQHSHSHAHARTNMQSHTHTRTHTHTHTHTQTDNLLYPRPGPATHLKDAAIQARHYRGFYEYSVVCARDELHALTRLVNHRRQRNLAQRDADVIPGGQSAHTHASSGNSAHAIAPW